MLKHKGEKISYMIFDNNIPLGELPINSAFVDFENQQLQIYHESSFLNFLDKANLDAEQSLANEAIIYSQEFKGNNPDLLGEIFAVGYVLC